MNKEIYEDSSPFPQVITQNSQMIKILWKLELVKNTKLSILFEGETGTGKDFLARAVHDSSDRHDKNFFPVNCSALPEPLLESEIFGHKQGSFTGASFDKKGLFEEADGGTLYVDEIADLSSSIQAKLLRALEEGVITRLGETQPRKIDIRVIASTSKDLAEGVELGTFRKDLFYRLNVVHLKIPPLRERIEDIPILVDYFIRVHSGGDQKALSLKSFILEQYSDYDWPGNVRELLNEVKRILAYGTADTSELMDSVVQKSARNYDPKFANLPLKEYMDICRRNHILKALSNHDWSIESTARALKIHENTLRYQIRRLNIKILKNRETSD